VGAINSHKYDQPSNFITYIAYYANIKSFRNGRRPGWGSNAEPVTLPPSAGPAPGGPCEGPQGDNALGRKWSPVGFGGIAVIQPCPGLAGMQRAFSAPNHAPTRSGSALTMDGQHVLTVRSNDRPGSAAEVTGLLFRSVETSSTLSTSTTAKPVVSSCGCRRLAQSEA
jgi:hypothetical protein